MDKTTDLIQSAFTMHDLFSFIGIVIIIIAFFYILYAFLITRQVKLLTRSFSSPIAGFFAGTAFIHLLLSALIAFLALISL